MKKTGIYITSGIIFSIVLVMSFYVFCINASGIEISEESRKQAKKHFNRGIAAVELAESSEDYGDAIHEFKKAIEFDPGLRDAYYNLAIVQDKAGEYEEAMANLETLKESVTSEDEEADLQTLIDKVEYKVEKKKEQDEYDAWFDTFDEPVVAVEEDTRPIVIPEIGARVESIKFYKGDQIYVDYEERDYIKHFRNSDTDYVYGSIVLNYPAPGRRVDIPLKVVYIKPNGDFDGKYNCEAYAEPNWVRSYHPFGLGSATFGTWETGRYQVEVYYKGDLIATEEFTVY